MIELKNLTKKFDKITAVSDMSLEIENGSVTGLVGSNGSGKSTLLRLLSGVYRPDGGEIILDGEKLFDNYLAKGKCCFIPDFPFFYNSATINKTAFLYRRIYPNWSEEAFLNYCSLFPIDRNARIINMSKGMQRQAALILGLSTCPKYIFLDEIFDGLDPVIRKILKKILISHVSDRESTVIIASHNLRELEDLCDRVCLMHKGKMLMEKNIDELRAELCKVQLAFNEPVNINEKLVGVSVVKLEQAGNIFNLIARGAHNDVIQKLQEGKPAYVYAVPLTLEEIFISEMEAAGYDSNTFLLG